MIQNNRFVANKALDSDGWLGARLGNVTATQVAGAATPRGFADAVEAIRSPTEIEDNAYMKFGRDSEGWISLWVKREFGIFPNEWLIASEKDPRYLATPDGLSLDHKEISEVKTTGQDWGEGSIPIKYRRQVQWQLFVTGAESCLFAWVERAEVAGRFVPAWFEPRTIRLERAEKEIEKLIGVAERLLDEKKPNDNANKGENK